MAVSTIDDVRNDPLAFSIASALTLANDAAKLQGATVSDCLVTITEETPPPTRSWRIHYGPRNYGSRRGGDLIVIIDEMSTTVTRVLRGQ